VTLVVSVGITEMPGMPETNDTTGKKMTAKKKATTRRASPPRRQTATRLPTEIDIAARAYQLFIQRGGEHGRDLDDWLIAKDELLSLDR
jgi:hypothetical protein